MSNLPFDKKRRRIRGKFLLWSGIVLLVGAAIVGASYFILYSDFFKVRGFEVGESRYVLEDKLLSVLNSDMIANSRILSILGTDNILFWEFSDKPEVLEFLPLAARISVRTDLGNRKVIIEVEERKFSGIWCLSAQEVPAGDCYAFDEDGIIFARAPEAEGSIILKVFSENDRRQVLGVSMFSRPEWLEVFFDVLGNFEDYGFSVSRVTIKDFQVEEWEAEIAEGPVFRFSLNFSPQNLEGILENLAEKFEFDKVTYFDFRVENRIYYE